MVPWNTCPLAGFRALRVSKFLKNFRPVKVQRCSLFSFRWMKLFQFFCLILFSLLVFCSPENFCLCFWDDFLVVCWAVFYGADCNLGEEWPERFLACCRAKHINPRCAPRSPLERSPVVRRSVGRRAADEILRDLGRGVVCFNIA